MGAKARKQSVVRDWIELFLVLAILIMSPVLIIGYKVGRQVRMPNRFALAAVMIGLGLVLQSVRDLIEVRREFIDQLQQALFWSQVQNAAFEVVQLDLRTSLLLGVGVGVFTNRTRRAKPRSVTAPDAISFGRVTGGHAPPFMRAGDAVFNSTELRRHAVVLGSTGSGKTVTTMHLAAGVAKLGWSVWYIDAKGDHDNAVDFYGACTAAGVEPGQIAGWPYQAWDAWRGDPRDIANRILATQDFTEPYYRECARLGIQLAAEAPGVDTPRTSTALLDAVGDKAIAKAWRGSSAAKDWAEVDRQTRLGVSMRLRGFFSSVGAGLDGCIGFEDKRAGYFAIDAVSLRDASESVGRLLLEDLTHWAARRKPKDEPALVIIDEFSAISSSSDQVAGMIERLRGFNVAVVLVSQSLSGLGDQGERILDACGTLMLHQGSDPERLTNRAGTFTVAEPTMQVDGVGPTGMGSLRLNDQFSVSPNDVRRLAVGECIVVHGGSHLRVAVHPPTETSCQPPRWWGVLPNIQPQSVREPEPDLEGLEL